MSAYGEFDTEGSAERQILDHHVAKNFLLILRCCSCQYKERIAVRILEVSIKFC